METKYIFLDIDGTLVGRNNKVPESALEAVKKARESGHKVFICSGRSRCEMHQEIIDIGFDGIVGAAGAYVELDGKMIYHRPMTEQMNQKLLDYFTEKKLGIMIETNDVMFINDNALVYVEQFIKHCKEKNIAYDKKLFDLAVPLTGIKEPAKLPINKILYVMSPYPDEMLWNDLQDEFTVVSSAIEFEGNCGEISELGMHKGNGINVIMKHFGEGMENTIGIGDSDNDTEMLKIAGIGIAMGNARESLKEIADYITTDVEEEGIKNAFVHYGLI